MTCLTETRLDFYPGAIQTVCVFVKTKVVKVDRFVGAIPDEDTLILNIRSSKPDTGYIFATDAAWGFLEESDGSLGLFKKKVLAQFFGPIITLAIQMYRT